jgi:hypothetical protein
MKSRTGNFCTTMKVVRTPNTSDFLWLDTLDEVNRRLQSFQTPEKLDYTLEIDW